MELSQKEKNNIYMKEWSKRPENRERINEGRRNEWQNLTEEEHQRRKDNMKIYHQNNKDRAKQYKKDNEEQINEYMKEYRKTEVYKKSYRITNWKKSGVINDDFNSLYEYYINCKNCEDCNVELQQSNYGANKKCLDHDHTTGQFRNVICHRCNVIRGNNDRIDLS